MGQITSQISGYFTDKPEKEINEEQNTYTKIERKENVGLKNGGQINYKKFNDSVCSASPYASPRQPLKRSRPLSPNVSFSSLPKSILDIFSPAKKARIEEDFLDFPYLVDKKTINYLHKSKIIIILRGLPGSGKSTISKHLKSKYFSSCEVCSADSYFMVNGEYDYNFELIGEAHKQCQQNAINAALAQKSVIVIDNTNLKLWEMKFYFDLAQEFNYVAIPVEPLTPWRRDDEILATKNSHNVDKSIISLKRQSFEDFLPLYYGWFFNERDSFMLISEGLMWIEEAYKFSEFREDLSHYTGTQCLEDLLNYYEKPGEGFILHCTAKFTGKGSVADSQTYMEMEEVKKSAGKAFDTEVIGFIITPRTLGARIRLSQEQLPLWGQNDDEDVPEDFWTVSGATPIECDANGSPQNSLQLTLCGKANDLEGSEELEHEHILGITNGHQESLDISSVATQNEVIESSVNISYSSVDVSLQKEVSNSPKTRKHRSDVTCSTNDSLVLTPSKVNKLLYNGTTDQTPDKKVLTNGDCDNNNSDVAKLNKVMPEITLPTEVASDLGEKSSPSKLDQRKGSKKNKRSNRHTTGKVIIPANIIPIEESKTSSTFSDVPQNTAHKHRFTPTSGIGQRAHITLGCAPLVKPVTTGLDLLFAIQMEQESILKENYVSKQKNTVKRIEGERDVAEINPVSSDSLDSQPFDLAIHNSGAQPKHVINIQGTILKNYGHGLWVVYPRDKLRIASLFAFS